MAYLYNLNLLHLDFKSGKKKKLQQDKKDQQDALKATINTELAEVQHSLNTEMASLNEQVCGSSSFQPPRIELNQQDTILRRLMTKVQGHHSKD